MRVLAFDVAVPLAAIAALLMIGVMLGWPAWWVSTCSILCLLVVQAVIVNIVLYRRDSVTVGTDDNTPVLRLAVVGTAAGALVVAVAVGYNQWTLPDRAFQRDSDQVVSIAREISEATATFAPGDSDSLIDQATRLMVEDRAEAFKAQFAAGVAQLAKRNTSAQARTISAGLEALGPEAASVAVLMRGTQSAPGQAASTAVLALRVGLTKQDGTWKVFEVAPINSR